MSAIFISHSKEDNHQAAELNSWLHDQHFDVDAIFLDFDSRSGIDGGKEWEQELFKRLRQCRAIIALCSQNFTASQWCISEIAIAMGGREKKKVIPIKISPCDLPELLKGIQMIDFTINVEDGRERLLRSLKEAGLDPSEVSNFDPDRVYPGLKAFEEKDAGVFFGRRGAIEDGEKALRRLVGNPWGTRALMVIGPSGSGKSSLVRAGLLPLLRRNRQSWLVLDPFRPGSDPYSRLAVVLAKAFEGGEEDKDFLTIAKQLQEAASAQPVDGEVLVKIMNELLTRRHLPDDATVIMIIDQFEELLDTAGGSKQDRQTQIPRFLNLLRNALEARFSRFILLGTLRSDFLDKFQCDPSLNGLKIETLLVGKMGVDDYMKVIEEPARVAGIELEEGLPEKMREDIGSQDALPLLAFTLSELWRASKKRNLINDRLTLEDYNTLGGLTGSIESKANELYTSLDEHQKRALQQVFLRMTRLTEDGQYTRKTAYLAEMPPGSQEILDRFAHGRLLVLDSVEETKEATVEVAHEALLRNWTVLKDWLDENQEFLLWRKKLDVKVNEWKEWKKTQKRFWFKMFDSLLWGSMLVEAYHRRRLLKGSQEKQLINVSMMVTGGIIGLIMLVSIAILIFVLIQWQSTKRALSQQFKVQHEATIESDPLGSVIAGLAAMNHYINDTGINYQLTKSLEDALSRNFALSKPIETGQVSIYSLVSLKNGEIIVSGGDDGTLRYFNVREWKAGKSKPLKQPSKVLTLLAPDGIDQVLISGHQDGHLSCWSNGTEKPSSKEGMGAILSLVALKARDNLVISGHEGGQLGIWKKCNLLAEISSDQGNLLSLVVLGTGELVSGGSDGTLRRWRVFPSGDTYEFVPQGGRIDAGQQPTEREVRSLLALNQDELISGGSDGWLRHWKNGVLVGKPINTEQGEVLSLLKLADGEFISGGANGTMRRWKVDQSIIANGEPIKTAGSGVTGLVNVKLDNSDLVSSSDDHAWVSSSDDGTITLWKDHGTIGTPRQTEQRRMVRLIALENGELVGGAEDGTLWICTTLKNDCDGGKGTKKLSSIQRQVKSLLPLKNGSFISGGSDGTLIVWRRDGTPISKPIQSGQEQVRSLELFRNGNIVSGGSDGTLQRWQLNTNNMTPEKIGKPINTDQGEANTLAMSKDGRLLISSGVYGKLRLWKLGFFSGAPLQPLGGANPSDETVIMSIATLINGNLITGDNNGNLLEWTEAGKRLGAPINSGHGQVMSLISLKNGKFISGGNDGKLRLWSSYGQKEGEFKSDVEFNSGEEPVVSLVVAETGELITGSMDGAIKIFSPINVVEAACREVKFALVDPTTAAEENARDLCAKHQQDRDREWGDVVGKFWRRFSRSRVASD